MPVFRRPVRLALAASLGLALAAPAAIAHDFNRSAVWWDPAENGWGLFLTDQGDVLAPVWFTFDEDGEPTWFLTPALEQPDGSWAGNIDRYTGVPYPDIMGSASNPPETLGTSRLVFRDDGKLDFAFTVDGATTMRTLERLEFGDRNFACRAAEGPVADATNYSDLWWNAASGGWGVHVAHVDDGLFATWYTYDLDGEAVYFSGATTRVGDGVYRGPLYRTRDGLPFDQINGAPATDGSDEVGSVEFRFADGANGSFAWTIEGVTWTRDITRLQLGSVPGTCESVDAVVLHSGGSGGSGGGGGAGDIECAGPYRVGDWKEYAWDDSSSGQYLQRLDVTGTATFEGLPALVEEQRIDGVLNGRSFVTPDQDDTIGSLGGDALDPAGNIITRSVNDPLPIERTRFFRLGETVALAWTVRSTSGGTTVLTEVSETVTLRGLETITTPAGTFETCAFDVVTTAATQGVSTRFEGSSWTSPVWQEVRREGTTATTTFGFTTEVDSLRELVAGEVDGNAVP